MKRKRKLRSGVVFPHRIECSLQAARHSAAALTQFVEDVLDQRHPEMPPEENRIEAAEHALEKVHRWLKSAREGIKNSGDC